MAERYDWPSPQWFEHILSLSRQSSGAPRPELTYRAQYIITGSPCGEVCIFEEMREGRMVAMFRGKRGDADVTVTLDYGDYLKIWTELKSSHELPSYRIEGDVAVMAGSIAQRNEERYKSFKRYICNITRWP